MTEPDIISLAVGKPTILMPIAKRMCVAYLIEREARTR